MVILNSLLVTIGSHQHGVASNEVIGWLSNHSLNADMMASEKTQIQTFAKRAVSHAKRVTKGNGQNPGYHVVVTIRGLQLRTEKDCPAEKSWSNDVKNEHHLRFKKTYDPKDILNTIMQEIASEDAAG